MCVMRDRNAYGFKGDGIGKRGRAKWKRARKEEAAGCGYAYWHKDMRALWPLRALQGPEAELVSCSSLDAGGL